MSESFVCGLAGDQEKVRLGTGNSRRDGWMAGLAGEREEVCVRTGDPRQDGWMTGLAGDQDQVCLRTADAGQAGRNKGFCQLDGNESLDESDLESVSDQDPPPWHDPYTKKQEPRIQTLRGINTNN